MSVGERLGKNHACLKIVEALKPPEDCLKMLTSRGDPSISWRAVTWKVDPTNGNNGFSKELRFTTELSGDQKVQSE